MTPTFHLGIEDMEPNNWVAWVFELPGCYSRASTREDTIEIAPAAIQELLERLRQSSLLKMDPPSDFEINISEEFRSIPYSPDYLVNAFFENDQIPLSVPDIIFGTHVLNLNRRELLSIAAHLPQNVLEKNIDGEVQKSIRGILRHIGTAEWWYWDRLGLTFPRTERPDDIFNLLDMVRQYTLEHISDLVGSTEKTTCSGEDWSPRKLLRRAIWHERVHTLQITRYLKSMSSN